MKPTRGDRMDERYGGPRFDGGWYASRYASFMALGSDPLGHYIDEGREQGCRPNSAVLGSVTLPHPYSFTPSHIQGVSSVLRNAGVFDQKWYGRRYAVASREALVHYIVEGAYEGLDPNPFFSSAYYFDLHADVARAGVNPLWHFVVYGFLEGRRGMIKPSLLGSLDFEEGIWRHGLKTARTERAFRSNAESSQRRERLRSAAAGS